MKECNACGKCCQKYSDGGLSASKREIEIWEIEQPHIFKYVRQGNIWMDPVSGQQIEVCPWLKKVPAKPPSTRVQYHCDIYEHRPDDCRFYPSTLSEMILDECEMIEPKDIKNPKQAHISLASIMEDSHRYF